MYRLARTSFWTVVFVFILLISVGNISAQKIPIGTLWEDTAINPHDFTDQYYLMNGINPKTIIGRRNGEDGLSVISPSSNPFHTNVRVIATIPAYDENGGVMFWYPLGDLHDYAFTDDKIGYHAREMAGLLPIYVFPSSRVVDFRAYSSTRQAALMDNSWFLSGNRYENPLGIREVFAVSYTEKAFAKEGIDIMRGFIKKNGASTDDTPIIRTMEDLNFLMKLGFVEATATKSLGGRYVLAPHIADPTNGVIAKDAF